PGTTAERTRCFEMATSNMRSKGGGWNRLLLLVVAGTTTASHIPKRGEPFERQLPIHCSRSSRTAVVLVRLHADRTTGGASGHPVRGRPQRETRLHARHKRRPNPSK